MMFINAMDAPSRVIEPMIKAPVVTMFKLSIKLFATLSLRVMLKLSRSFGTNFLTLRISAIHCPCTASRVSALGALTLRV